MTDTSGAAGGSPCWTSLSIAIELADVRLEALERRVAVLARAARRRRGARRELAEDALRGRRPGRA